MVSSLQVARVDPDLTHSILVVQRNPRARRRLCSWLSTAGYHVDESDSFAKIDLVNRSSPDLVIQDINFPGTDCHELAQELRGHFGTCVPILCLSGFLCNLDETRAIKSGYSHVLVKPVDPEDLVALVGSYLTSKGGVAHAAYDGQRQQATLRAPQLAVLAGVAEALAKAEPLDEVLGKVLEACLDMAGISEGAFYLLENGVLRLKHESGFTPVEIDNLHARLGCDAFLRGVTTVGITVLVPSAAAPIAISNQMLSSAGASSLLLVPISWAATPCGLLVLGARNAEISGDDAFSFARVVGSQIGLAIGLTQTFTKLAASEQRYRNLTENASDAIAIVSASGTICEVNHRLEELLGRPSGLAVGRTFRDLIAPDDEATFNVAFASGGRIPPVAIRKTDGLLVLVEFSLTPVLVGTEHLVLAIGRDITDQARAQMELIASERVASVGLLAAGLAHEINNPLASVIVNLDVLLEQYAEPALEDARAAAERVRLIVSDLKAFSRIDERRIALDLRILLESTLRLSWSELRTHARLVTSYGPGVPSVMANESRLAQMFLSLIGTAAHAVDNGADSGEVYVTTRADDHGDAVVEICDTGIGISADTLDRMFTPLFTTKATGLGLLTCRRIVAEFGGELAVASVVGKGTTVTITLPRAISVVREHSAPTATNSPRRGRVLVIDDDQMIRNAIARTLKGDHDLTLLAGATEAVDVIAAGARFDVILCDMMMPVMTGIEFYSRLLVLVPEQVERVVFLTGGSFTLGSQRFLASVSNVCVEKPFDFKSLRALVRERIG